MHFKNVLKPLVTYIMMMVLLSCSQKVEIAGFIFERKVLPQNKLQIKYRYQFGDKKYVDSAVVSNKILPVDTIHLIINTQKPEKAIPDLFLK